MKRFFVTLPSGSTVSVYAATLAKAAAYYPHAVSVVLVRDVPRLTPEEAVEATREGAFW